MHTAFLFTRFPRADAPAQSAIRVALEAAVRAAIVGEDSATVLTLCGADADLEATFAADEAVATRSYDLDPDSLAGEHHLAERVAHEVAELGATAACVLDIPATPGVACDVDRVGAVILAAAAVSAQGVSLRILDGSPEGTPAGEVDGRSFQRWLAARTRVVDGAHRRTATGVISTWNKCADVRSNLIALRAQSLPFDDVVVVDNASGDGTAEMIAAEFPEVRLVVMPHSEYGACETFNIGFASATTELIAILDDDVVLPPAWLEKTRARLAAEPDSTAIVSTKIVEPGMPESYRSSDEINRERYMSTFRGCASLGRRKALAEAGFYDERLFIYGNERDLTCRLLNLGYRVLQYPGVETFHKTPFGIKMGKRSLYYHARNAWLGMLKYAPLEDLLRLPFLVVSKVLFRAGEKEEAGEVTDATGTIGIGRSIRETPGASWVLFKAACSVIYNIPYCLQRREACTAPDFELPLE